MLGARRPASLLVTGVWIAALAILTGYVVRESIGRTTHGFIAYYAAARLFVSGQLDARVYDDESFGAYVQTLTQSDVREIYGPNTPAMALLALPVAFLDPANARTAWLLGCLVVLALASRVLLRVAQRADHRVLALVAALLIVRGRDVAAGMVLGLTLILKSSGWPLLLLVVAQRRFRAALAAIAVAAAVASIVLAIAGADVWLRYPVYVREFLDRPAASVTAYQTTRSLVRRLCIADPVWNPAPAAHCEAAAEWLPSFLTFGAVALTLLACRGARAEHWLAAGIVLSILAAPVGPSNTTPRSRCR